MIWVYSLRWPHAARTNELTNKSVLSYYVRWQCATARIHTPLLLLMMAWAPSRHRLRLASATELPGTVDSVDRVSASVVVKISSRVCRVPGQWSQCSSVCDAWPHLGQSGSTVLSIKCLCAWRRIQWLDLSWANSVASFLDAVSRPLRCSLWSAQTAAIWECCISGLRMEWNGVAACLSVSVKWLAVKTASEMTYIV